MKQKPWSKQETDQLMRLYEAGDKTVWPWAIIAHYLDREFQTERTVAACQSKFYRTARANNDYPTASRISK